MDTCSIFSNKMASEEVLKRGDLLLQLTGNAESRPTCESRASDITSVCFLKPGVIISARSSLCAISGHFHFCQVPIFTQGNCLGCLNGSYAPDSYSFTINYIAAHQLSYIVECH